ncbi:hypothetical protein Scel_86650 [Streptomyces cellostaticus]|nr:hypothetical protein Scel_86650 [Streptomyces cellostaticus]
MVAPLEGLGDDPAADGARGSDDSDVHGSPLCMQKRDATRGDAAQKLYAVKFMHGAK